MKRVFGVLSIFVALLAMSCASTVKESNDESADVASTNSADEKYFIDIENLTYDDESAEFDTLSYAIGMNFGMLAQSTYLDAGYDKEAFRNGFFEALNAENFDRDSMRRMVAYVDDYTQMRYIPYMRTKSKNEFMKTMNPDAEVVTPILYNEEFPMDRVSESMGKYFATQMRLMRLSLNRHWVEVAMDDAFGLENMEMADSVMQLSMKDYKATMSNAEFIQGIKDRLNEKCDEWLAHVAQQEGVCEYRPDETSDAAYYRIDELGGDVRATKECDSVYFDYQLYSCHGLLLESTEEMISAYDRIAERLVNDKSLSEEQREKNMAQIEKRREEIRSGGARLDNIKQKAVAGCIKEIGEGGQMTIWMPASHVLREAQNNAYTNDGLVMTINLRRVVPQEETATMHKPMPSVTKPGGTVVPSKKATPKLQIKAVK